MYLDCPILEKVNHGIQFSHTAAVRICPIFLVKHLQRTPNVDRDLITIDSFTRLYIGQTENFRDRERRRKGHIMENSHVKICLGHNLSHYQMDCLEVTTIGVPILTFGIITVNKTIHSRCVYESVPDTLTADNIHDHPTPDQDRNTFGLLQRAMLGVLNDLDYRRNLSEWRAQIQAGEAISNPVLDWEYQSKKSVNIRDLSQLLQSDDDDLPLFIDHYPDFQSKTYHDLFKDLEMADIMAADLNVKNSIENLNRHVIIFYRARPTLLFDKSQARRYPTEVCPYADFHWLPTGRCALLLWWPDLGARAKVDIPCRQMLEQIFRLLAHQLHLLLCKLEGVAGNDIGIPETQAVEIAEWLMDHTTSHQLEGLYKDVTSMWALAITTRFIHTAVHKRYEQSALYDVDPSDSRMVRHEEE
ncbi:hypothetical protein BGW37DRAFT_542072 [Umbelopsis sp. PMI_123]|nr:hypothetical protein BGW37DRAFT_542072 [Umbelopsis sp. PMI_123]